MRRYQHPLWLAMLMGCSSVRPAPSPADPRLHDTSLSTTNATCARCHTTISAAFEASAHHRGLDNPAFVAEWEPEQLTFCSDCHAPLGPADTALDGDAVGCVACHTPTARGVFEPVDDERCIDCHEFHFPSEHQVPDSPYPETLWLQSTGSEWRRAQDAVGGRGCIACHMQDHAMTRGEAPVLDVTTRWLGPDWIELVLRATPAVGHAVPTGDVFRGLAIEAVAADGRAVGRALLRRRFVGAMNADGQLEMRELDDRRVPPPSQGERRVRLHTDGPAAGLSIWVERRGGSIRDARAAVEIAAGARRRIWSGPAPRDPSR